MKTPEQKRLKADFSCLTEKKLIIRSFTFLICGLPDVLVNEVQAVINQERCR
jgi:hypothetical protein